MKIAVIIAIVQSKLANELLLSIRQNSIIPDQVILINNTREKPGGFRSHISGLPITEIIPQHFLGTNEAWTEGLKIVSPDIDIICILNDDLLLNHFFFEKMIEVMEEAGEQAVCAIPSLVPKGDIRNLKRIQLQPNKYSKAKYRRGYAMSLRRSFLHKVPPIPKGLKIYYGDNWYFDTARSIGGFWVLMQDNPVFHYIGTTAKQFEISEIRPQRKKEQRILIKEFRRWRIRQLTGQTSKRQS